MSKPFDWNEVFSSENKARTIRSMQIDREHCPYTFSLEPNFKRAAVLVPLCYDVLGRPSLLYNLRSLSMSKHRGEISFPGGLMEMADNNDLVITALRETEEELGINRNKIEVWTPLRDLPTVSASMGVTPILGFIHGWNSVDPAKLKINPDEVDHAFTVTLEHLCDSKNWDESTMRGKFDFAAPIYKNLNVFNDTKEVELWGLTAVITHLALTALLPGVYKREINFLKLFEPETENVDSKL